jgi:hypothetical protein
MKEKTIRGYATGAAYLPPEGGESKVTMTVRRRAPQGSKSAYGDTWLNLEISLPPYIARDLVRAVRSGLVKVKEEKAQSLRGAETWLEEIEKAARA